MFRDLWSMFGSLYSGCEDEWIAADVLASLEDEIAPVEAPRGPFNVIEGEAESGDLANAGGGTLAGGATWGDIGRIVGGEEGQSVSRERARQMYLSALHHFVENWNKMYPGDKLPRMR